MAKFKFKLVEDFQIDERTQKAINAYRDFANLEEGVKVESIDEWALNEAACKYNYKPELLKEALLKEDTLEKAAKDLEAEIASGNEN